MDRLESVSQDATVELAGLLVERCVAGEPAAWRSLHRQYYPNAMSVLRRLGVCATQLEDCCQDVFLDVFRYLPRFRQEARGFIGCVSVMLASRGGALEWRPS